MKKPDHQTSTLADIADQFAEEWARNATASGLAATLGCAELDALTAVLAASGRPDAATLWIEGHRRAEPTDCHGHVAPRLDPAPLPHDEHGRYSPIPGTEYPFSVSDVARAVVVLLGPDWHAESGSFGTAAIIAGPYIGGFGLLVDGDGDLCIEFAQYEEDDWPESPELPDGIGRYSEGVYLSEAASASDGLDFLAAQVAAAVRAVAGR
ncbi:MULTISPECIES: hypothetical protein [unclassified Streptomyces]|uniref:hypothetical protein n=1 Tax=unclassified Streptomyces TaxID=2593676 RepID=UPI00380FB495